MGDASALGGAPAREDARHDGDVRAARLRRRRRAGAALGELSQEAAARGVALDEERGRRAGADAVRARRGGRRARLRVRRRQRRRPRGRAHRDRLVRTAAGRSVRRAWKLHPGDRAAASELPVRGQGSQRRRPPRHHLRPRPRRRAVLVGAAGAASPTARRYGRSTSSTSRGRRRTRWRSPISMATGRRSWSPASASGRTTAAIPAPPSRRRSTTTSGTRAACGVHAPHHFAARAKASRWGGNTAWSI